MRRHSTLLVEEQLMLELAASSENNNIRTIKKPHNDVEAQC